jgi:hypothetical protein
MPGNWHANAAAMGAMRDEHFLVRPPSTGQDGAGRDAGSPHFYSAVTRDDA